MPPTFWKSFLANLQKCIKYKNKPMQYYINNSRNIDRMEVAINLGRFWLLKEKVNTKYFEIILLFI